MHVLTGLRRDLLPWFDACAGELGKILGAKWKEMSDEEKKVSHTRQIGLCRVDAPRRVIVCACADWPSHVPRAQPYNVKAENDKGRYEQAKAAYDASN